MMKKKTLFTLAAAVVITVWILPGLVFAQAGMPGQGRQAGAYPGQYARSYVNPELRLTTDQMTQQNRVWSEFQQETIQIRTDIFNRQMQINSLLNSEKPDTEKIRQLQNELNTLQGEFSQRRMDKILATRELLTPEQRAVYAPCYGRGQPGMMGFKGRGHRGGAGRAPGQGCLMW